MHDVSTDGAVEVNTVAELRCVLRDQHERIENLETWLSEKEQRDNAEKYSDELTGLYNLRKLNRFVERSTGGLWYVLCDLNKFKRINDTQGHDAGDHMLQVFAKFLEHCSRKCDRRKTLRATDRRGVIEAKDEVFQRIAVRTGGDEFIVVCQSERGARAVAARIRAWRYEKTTASAGIGSSRKAADDSMYKYKRRIHLTARLKWWGLLAGMTIGVALATNMKIVERWLSILLG